MKVRMGYVSNSSSSSFLIYGVYIESDSIEAFANMSNEPDEDERAREYIYEFIPKDSGIAPDGSYDDDGFYLGISWDQVGDDETGKQFKERVKVGVLETLTKAGYRQIDELEFGTHAEAWRDG